MFGLPYRAWRPRQASTIERILDSPKRIVVVQAPTGVGKTAIALGCAVLSGQRAAMLTATKGLQDQYAHVAGDLLTDIRGANNYECLAAKDQFADQFPTRVAVGCDEGPCLVGWSCDRRRPSGCLYFDQLKRAIAAPLVVTSYAYWLSANRWAEGIGTRELLILDEAHDAPDQVATQMEVIASAAQLGARLPASDTLADWRVWARSQVDGAQARAESAPRARDRLHWKRQHQTLTLIASMTEDAWVIERVHEGKARLAPIQVHPFVDPLLFARASRVVLLSATVTPADVARLGVAPAEVEWISLPSPFPLARRPVIVVADAGRIDHRMTPETRAWWVRRMAHIIEPRLDRKGLVHTVSYARQGELAAALEDAVDGDVHIFAPPSSTHLRSYLDGFRRAGPGAIFLSPSIMTGLDFPDTDAEYQILAKVPFPDTRSAIMKARLAADETLRQTIALKAIIQASGRIVRSVRDQGETFIVDAHAIWFLRQVRRHIPSWFVKAVRITADLPDPLPKL